MIKKLYIFIVIILIAFPQKINANIICNDGTVSPTCNSCRPGCCSSHQGCTDYSYNNYGYSEFDSYNNSNENNSAEMILMIIVSFCIWPGSLFLFGYLSEKKKK